MNELEDSFRKKIYISEKEAHCIYQEQNIIIPSTIEPKMNIQEQIEREFDLYVFDVGQLSELAENDRIVT